MPRTAGTRLGSLGIAALWAVTAGAVEPLRSLAGCRIRPRHPSEWGPGRSHRPPFGWSPSTGRPWSHSSSRHPSRSAPQPRASRSSCRCRCPTAAWNASASRRPRSWPPIWPAAFPRFAPTAARGWTTPPPPLRFDLTPSGFHAQVLRAGDSVYIDPLHRGEVVLHQSYLKLDLRRNPDEPPFVCHVRDPEGHADDDGSTLPRRRRLPADPLRDRPCAPTAWPSPAPVSTLPPSARPTPRKSPVAWPPW